MVRLQIIRDDVMAMLQQAAGRAANLSRPFRVSAMRLRSDVMRNFRQGGWFPETWQPSQKSSGKTLIRQATLRNSFHEDSGAMHAQVGSDLLYAGIHEFGGTIEARNPSGRLHFRVDGQWVSPVSVEIPARPMLPVDSAGRLHPETSRFIADAFLSHITGEGTA